MPVVVIIHPHTPGLRIIEVEGIELTDDIGDLLDTHLAEEIDKGIVWRASIDSNTITFSLGVHPPSTWYVKVIDAVKDFAGTEHEVLSRLSNWP